MDQKWGLTQERRDFRLLYGDPWFMVQNLLGHSSREVIIRHYLAPVADLQLRSMLVSKDGLVAGPMPDLDSVFTRIGPGVRWHPGRRRPDADRGRLAASGRGRGRGRRASSPPADHTRPEVLAVGGTVVHHRNKYGRVKSFDFSALPVAEPMQRSLAAVFAARCIRRWTVHTTADQAFDHIMRFAQFLAALEQPPGDFDQLTVAMVKRWRHSRAGRPGGYQDLVWIGSLLRDDERLAAGPVADELARRLRPPASQVQSYGEVEFEVIIAAARRMFRIALLRIEANAEYLERRRRAEFVAGTQQRLLGEGLDHLARTGDVPRYAPSKPSPSSNGGRRQILRRYRKPVRWAVCRGDDAAAVPVPT